MNRKKYLIRIYVSDSTIGNIINMLIRLRVLRLQKSFDGLNGILAIYDVICGSQAISELTTLKVKYFPLDNYEDFVIYCPECGQRINDDMILRTYDENVLSGYNINCYSRVARFRDCGMQMAEVHFRPE